ncbi:MAG: 16S rRNA (adenine(1518)-N(6)/adenine(1519)-N(6))-dimethyltransferase RsmA [Actinomycetota bacterium]
MAPTSTGGSSTSPTTPSRRSPRSDPERSTSASPGRALTRRSLIELAERHGIRPKKSLGQHFLADGNSARAIARDAGAAPGERFLEIGAGLGSLTVALTGAGAEVLAVEADRALVPALEEVVEGLPVRVVNADAMDADWAALLGSESWRMASNLPYNVAVPVLMRLLEEAPGVDPFLVMVQREVGERLAAGPGEDAFGAVSLKVAYRAEVKLVRRVGPKVFWPEPKVDSVVLRISRRPPPVETPEAELFRLIDEGFAQRRKMMASALVRLGMDRPAAREALVRASLDEKVRAEELGLEDFARLGEALRG